MKVRILCTSTWKDLPSEYVRKINAEYNIICVRDENCEIEDYYVKVSDINGFKDLIYFMHENFKEIIIRKSIWVNAFEKEIIIIG